MPKPYGVSIFQNNSDKYCLHESINSICKMVINLIIIQPCIIILWTVLI